MSTSAISKAYEKAGITIAACILTGGIAAPVIGALALRNGTKGFLEGSNQQQQNQSKKSQPQIPIDVPGLNPIGTA